MNNLQKAANMLREASVILQTLGNDPAGSSDSGNSTASLPINRNEVTSRSLNVTQGGSTQRVPQLGETLAHARSMMSNSSTAGLFRRLNRNERLRAAPAGDKEKGKKRSRSESNMKPFEFVLLKAAWSEKASSNDDEYDGTVNKDSIVLRGIVQIEKGDSEVSIRKKLQSSLQSKYELIGPNDFEFVKVVQKKIQNIHLGKNIEYNSNVVKKLAGQGLLYIRMKDSFHFITDEESEISELMVEIPEVVEIPDEQPTFICPPTPAQDELSTIINEFPPGICNPVEMINFLQQKLAMGRQLDVNDPTVPLTGETNYITVDRNNILATTFEELKEISNPRITFEVQFYGEQAQDRGGPRKEWIRLCNQDIKEKYFDHGLREHLANDYFYIGQLAGIALLQNGQLPRYFPEEVLEETFGTGTSQQDPSTSACIAYLQAGLDTLGLQKFGAKFPLFLHLLRPSETSRLSVKMLLQILKPQFSEEGSNALCDEKEVYSKFVKYAREVSSGRRNVSLEDILAFVTGTSEEPPLGFGIPPSIVFVVAEKVSFEFKMVDFVMILKQH